MLDKQEIRKEIARLEYEESSYPNYAKLADLYIIRAEMEKPDAKIEPRYERLYSGATAPTEMHIPQNTVVMDAADSDFLKAVSGKDADAVWKIMDELMESLQVMQPRTYNAVMRQLRELKNM